MSSSIFLTRNCIVNIGKRSKAQIDHSNNNLNLQKKDVNAIYPYFSIIKGYILSQKFHSFKQKGMRYDLLIHPFSQPYFFRCKSKRRIKKRRIQELWSSNKNFKLFKGYFYISWKGEAIYQESVMELEKELKIKWKIENSYTGKIQEFMQQ